MIRRIDPSNNNNPIIAAPPSRGTEELGPEFSRENILQLSNSLHVHQDEVIPLSEPLDLNLETPIALAPTLPQREVILAQLVANNLLVPAEEQSPTVAHPQLSPLFNQNIRPQIVESATHTESGAANSDPTERTVDVEKLKGLFNKRIFSKFTDDAKVFGDKLIRPMAVAFQRSDFIDQLLNIGFKNREEIENFLKDLMPKIDRDKKQSIIDWKLEIFNRMDQAFAGGTYDPIAGNQVVFLMGDIEGVGGEILDIKKWETLRFEAIQFMILSPPDINDENDPKKTTAIEDNSSSKQVQIKSGYAQLIETTKDELEDKKQEEIKELREKQEKENMQILKKEWFEQGIFIKGIHENQRKAEVVREVGHLEFLKDVYKHKVNHEMLEDD